MPKAIRKAQLPSTGGEIIVPSNLRQDALDVVINKAMEGWKLASICAPDNMPSVSLVRRWLAGNTAFRQKYIEAQGVRALEEAGNILDIADGKDDPEEEVARSSLRVKTRLQLAEKLLPEYSTKTQHNITLSEQFQTARNSGHILPSETIIEGEQVK